MKATDLLKKDHNTVKKLFSELIRSSSRATKKRQTLIEKLAHELEVHTRIEEDIFYPAMRACGGEAERLVQEAEEEHQEAKELLAEIQGMDPGAADLVERVKELKQAVLHHATEEEHEMFPLAKEELGAEELGRLGRELAERKKALAGEPRKAA
jgi:hemerythrin superfamily protein